MNINSVIKISGSMHLKNQLLTDSKLGASISINRTGSISHTMICNFIGISCIDGSVLLYCNKNDIAKIQFNTCTKHEYVIFTIGDNKHLKISLYDIDVSLADVIEYELLLESFNNTMKDEMMQKYKDALNALKDMCELYEGISNGLHAPSLLLEQKYINAKEQLKNI